MGSFGATVKRMCPLERGPRQAAVTLPSATRGSVGPSGARRYRVAPAPSLKGQALPPSRVRAWPKARKGSHSL